MEMQKNDKQVVDSVDAPKTDLHADFIDDFDGFEPIPDIDLKKVMGGLAEYQRIDDSLSM